MTPVSKTEIAFELLLKLNFFLYLKVSDISTSKQQPALMNKLLLALVLVHREPSLHTLTHPVQGAEGSESQSLRKQPRSNPEIRCTIMQIHVILAQLRPLLLKCAVQSNILINFLKRNPSLWNKFEDLDD